jgi:AraC family transcriptional regulator
MAEQPLWADYETRMNRVIDYMHDRLDQPLDLDELAEVACLSRYHWHRVFHALKGETVHQMIGRLRMAKAASELVKTDDPLDVVASRVGFANVRSFSRSFSAAYGVSPGRFRQEGDHTVFQQTEIEKVTKMFPIEIQTLPERVLHGFAHKGDYMKISNQFEKVFGTLATANQLPHMRGMAGVYYDDPGSIAQDELRSFAGVFLAEGADVPEAFDQHPVSGGRCVVMHYKGPYSAVKAAYDWLYGEWLPKSGEEVADAPPFEVYLNTPEDTAPADLLTDIHLPLRSS